MSRDEFEELLYYVVELKDKLNTKLDEQCAKINCQGSIINQQGQITDELCWQLRELSEKVRELRAENHRLQERLDRFCPKCTGCQCGSSTYENHLADRYNALAAEEELRGKKLPSPTPTPQPPVILCRDTGDKSVKMDEGPQQQKIDEYAQVTKKRDNTTPTGGNSTIKKKWLFGGSFDRKESTPSSKSVVSSKTTWYLDEESVYEPIELSAKPTTRAQLEKISAEVSSVPKPAPRRLYAAQAVDNLAQYFGKGSHCGEEDDSDDVMLRPSRLKQFNSESRRGSSKVACSQVSNLEQSYLPTEEIISTENFVRFTINSRPATAVPLTTNNKDTPDKRRHAIRSYM